MPFKFSLLPHTPHMELALMCACQRRNNQVASECYTFAKILMILKTASELFRSCCTHSKKVFFLQQLFFL